MRPPRGLSAEEQAAWARLAASVKPLPDKVRPAKPAPESREILPRSPRPVAQSQPAPKPAVAPPASRPVGQSRIAPGNLDSHWDKRLKQGQVAPDFTLDLHGANLDAAYTRLMRGMAQARAMNARVMLVVTGKPRPVDPADRGTRRGAIRAKTLDWLAASEHGSGIAAVRKAHRKHGGDGALYLVLKR